MSLIGTSVLVNWGGVLEEKEIDYNQWHSMEHMPERISLPGFLRGFRAQGEPGTHIEDKYFMMYEAKNKEIFVSKKYLERLNNPTKWTKLKLSIPQIIKLVGVTGMHVLLGDNNFGQMKTEEKKYRSSQGLDDQVVSQVIIIEGLNYSALRKAVESFVVENSINVKINIKINYYCCQHTLTKQDVLGV
jgi:hypothetical protein